MKAESTMRCSIFVFLYIAYMFQTGKSPRNECFLLYHPVCTMSAALLPFIILSQVEISSKDV
jgi:hypothetical protein